MRSIRTTWNPVSGCSKVSPGCAHCYAEAFAERFRGVPGHPYEQGFDLRLWPERLVLPLRWWKPRLVFVNSMSDLFHEGVPDAFVARVFEVMTQAHWHTFQVLTKRSQRLAELAPRLPWPANVWMGVSIENRRFVGRADDLRRVPASVRFISAEPLLGPLKGLSLEELDWLIVGGESGPGARPLNLAWARDLVARCRAAGVAVFVKQLGTRWARRGKGNNPEAWPADLHIREMPVMVARRCIHDAARAAELATMHGGPARLSFGGDRPSVLPAPPTQALPGFAEVAAEAPHAVPDDPSAVAEVPAAVPAVVARHEFTDGGAQACACGCGRPVPVAGSGPPRRYATDACRAAVYRRRRAGLPVDLPRQPNRHGRRGLAAIAED